MPFSEHLRQTLTRLRALFLRKQLEQDLDEELAFHRSMREGQIQRDDGLPQEAAHIAASRTIGSEAKWKDYCRDAWRFNWLEEFLQDLRYGARTLRKSPSFTAVALLTLALAVGANTAVFSLVNTLLLRPLNSPDSHRLMLLRMAPGEGYSFSYPLFRQIEHDQQVFSEVFAFAGHGFHVQGTGGVEEVSGSMVSGSFFAAFRVPPETGRYLIPSDDVQGGAPVVVVSSRFRDRFFGSGAAVIGRHVVLDRVDFTIVGVMPAHFQGAEPLNRRELYIPLALEPLVDAPFNSIAGGIHSWWMRVGGRVRPGVSPEAANQWLHRGSSNILHRVIQDPKWTFNHRTRDQIYLAADAGAGGYSYLRFRFRRSLLVLMGLVLVVLLVASLNLASLLLARSAARERELATRFALGASRSRVMRQLLTESLLLTCCGAGIGVAMSPALVRVLITYLSQSDLTLAFDASPDWRVLAFTAVVSIVAAVITGLTPALRSTGRDLRDRMHDHRSSANESARTPLGLRILLGSEIACALVLVTGAALLAQSLIRIHSAPLGFNPANVTVHALNLQKSTRTPQAKIALYHDLQAQLSSDSGTKFVSFTSVLPVSGSVWTRDLTVPGKAGVGVWWSSVGPQYFEAMGTRLLAGRDFRWSDDEQATPVVIVNRAAARALYGEDAPVGKPVRLEEGATAPPAQIIGVVEDAKYEDVRTAAPPTAYAPMTQNLSDQMPSYTVVVRSPAPAVEVVTRVRDTIRRLAPEVPAPVALSMTDQLDEAISSERMMSMLSSFFAALALLITAIGMYGTLSYTTARRTSEIGIRMALGARPAQVISLILNQNVLLTAAGALVGVVLSLAGARIIESFLFETPARNGSILLISTAVLILIGGIASLLPALRAAKIDPLTAIRES